jgi:RimJ/RimL family protein N-acetyltransferase
MEVELCEYDEAFLHKSYGWLTDPYIKHTTDTPDITRESQLAWFNSLPQKTDYLIWGVRFHDKLIGACGLKNKTDRTAEYWGYIGDRSYHGHGLGYSMLSQVIKKAEEMNLGQVTLKVLCDNMIAYNLYKKCDFFEYHRDNRLIYMVRYMLDNTKMLKYRYEIGGGKSLSAHNLQTNLLWAA